MADGALLKGRPWVRTLSVATVLALPCAVARVLPSAANRVTLPPFLAFVLGPGCHWFVVLALVTLGVSLAPRSARLRRAWETLVAGADRRPALLGWLLVAVLAVVGYARVPPLRRDLLDLTGDEPKYLRMAMSLVNDSDVDVSGGRDSPPDLRLRLRQLAGVARSTQEALVSLVEGTPVPSDHRWDAGNWSIYGLHGGEYHVQPPGLPALLAVFIGTGQSIFPGCSPRRLAADFLVLCWILAAVETYRLSREVLGSRPGALGATALLFATAPVFVGGYHLYPESVGMLLVPFCFRRVHASGRPLRPASAVAAGLVAGGLWWIHPKFVVPSLALLAIGLLGPRASARTRLLLAAAFAVAAVSSLLYVYRLTGLFRPEGLYVRQAQEYRGVPSPLSIDFLAGLATGLVGARDGILLLAPVLLLAVAALPAAACARRRTTLELCAVFAAVWATSAVHWGVSLGPPARLFITVAFAPMLVLALGVRQIGPRPRVLLPLLLLASLSLAITVRTASYWRFAFNPYRGLFATPAQNFTRDLPARGRATVRDLARAALIIGAAAGAGLRWRRRATPETTAEFEAVALVGAAAALACALFALEPRVSVSGREKLVPGIQVVVQGRSVIGGDAHGTDLLDGVEDVLGPGRPQVALHLG